MNPGRLEEDRVRTTQKSAMVKRSLVLGWISLVLGGCCLRCVHPVTAPCATSECVAHCQTIPQPCKSKVFVFLLNGNDPLECGNLPGLRDYVQSLGFIKTYYGHMHHTQTFADEIRKCRANDVEARFVLVGFDGGASRVRKIAQSLQCEGVAIDLMVYLDPVCVGNESLHPPENVLRVVNLTSNSVLAGPRTIDGAENLHYPEAGHYEVPTYPLTLDTLAKELADVAARIHYFAEAPPFPIHASPTPRPIQRSPGADAGWDFLRPESQVLPAQVAPTIQAAPSTPADGTAN